MQEIGHKTENRLRWSWADGGVDPAKLPDALGRGYAGPIMFRKLLPRMIERDFAPARFAFQALKDPDMVHNLANELQSPTPMASQAANLIRILTSKGHGELTESPS